MAGRKQFEPDAALDRALRAFWERGYSGTSISDLLAATGLGRGSLYATFGDKQQLFLACLDRYVEQVGAAGREALAGSQQDVRARVMASFEAVLTRLADPAQPAGCLLAQTAAESGGLDEPVRTAVRRVLDEQVEAMRGVLAAHAGPHVPPAEVASLASYLVTVAQAIAVLHRAGTDVAELRRTAEHAVGALDRLAG